MVRYYFTNIMQSLSTRINFCVLFFADNSLNVRHTTDYSANLKADKVKFFQHDPTPGFRLATPLTETELKVYILVLFSLFFPIHIKYALLFIAALKGIFCVCKCE